MENEWATSMSVRVTIPSADSDDTFNAALDGLTAKAIRANSLSVLTATATAVQAIRESRTQAMHEGKDSGYAIDRTLLRVIENYGNQIAEVQI
jgi:hypothetical protein